MPPSARFSFSCDTLHDLDVIEWLNSFASRERGLAIKSAIRQLMQEGEVREGASPLAVQVDLGNIEEQMAEVMRAVKDLGREFAKSEKGGILVPANKDTYLEDQEVTGNLKQFFD